MYLKSNHQAQASNTIDDLCQYFTRQQVSTYVYFCIGLPRKNHKHDFVWSTSNLSTNMTLMALPRLIVYVRLVNFSKELWTIQIKFVALQSYHYTTQWSMAIASKCQLNFRELMYCQVIITLLNGLCQQPQSPS